MQRLVLKIFNHLFAIFYSEKIKESRRYIFRAYKIKQVDEILYIDMKYYLKLI